MIKHHQDTELLRELKSLTEQYVTFYDVPLDHAAEEIHFAAACLAFAAGISEWEAYGLIVQADAAVWVEKP